ncbi:MAG: SAM-dependent methyltransferase [Syntrophomonadaceae bacterium]|nr:SAM-dependent methyltransferase [Syntrophomonadaceae bacterium]
MIKLPKRLTTIADMVIKEKAVADIGADHALLSIYMMENRLISNAIVTDIIDGPYERAKKAVNESSYRDRIEVRKGDGIKVLKPYEVATVIVAGMGGDTIAQILSDDWEKAETYERFILQPMSRPHVLRQLLAERGWTLSEEKLVYENNKFFVILVYTPDDNPYKLTPLELDIGPILLEITYDYKREYLQSFLTKYKNISNSLSKSTTNQEVDLLESIKEKIKELEGLINDIDKS